MTQFVEYIIQNYTWFLGGAILILLAIIGYYADKTNFGQNKLKDVETEKENSKDDSSEEKNLIQEDNNIQEINLNIEQANTELDGLKGEADHDTRHEEPTLKDDYVKNHDMLKESTNVLNDSTNILEVGNDTINNEENSMQSEISETLVDKSKQNKTAEKVSVVLNEEEIEKFNQEFNSILPEKELINDDLLSDIDDLELGKTQKIDLSEIPNLDDIELPKIKNLVQEEQDIWKF